MKARISEGKWSQRLAGKGSNDNYRLIEVSPGYLQRGSKTGFGITGYINEADARAMVEGGNIARKHNLKAYTSMLTALKEIAKGEGRYSTDPYIHASYTIEDMKKIAVDAIRVAKKK